MTRGNDTTSASMSDHDHHHDCDGRKSDVSRREFLHRGGALVAGATLGLAAGGLTAAESDIREFLREKGPIPRRVLGRTGVAVPILGLGTALLGHQNRNQPELKKLVDCFGEAIDLGITYVDTARIYGRAEEALGHVLPGGRREEVFLVTKVWAETYDEAEKSFHESLRKMKVDSVDVLHLHHAGGKDIDTVLGKRGAWEFLQEAKKKGKTRFIGITGHARPANFVRMLETDTVDVMMVAMNFVDRHVYGFEKKVLPVARKHRTGVMAMKVYGGVQGKGFRNYDKPKPYPSQMEAKFHDRAVRYARSLEGVTGMVIGVHTKEQVHANIRRVLEARPLSKEEFAALVKVGESYAPEWTPRFGPVT